MEALKPPPQKKSRRIAAIDWMRGLVMILMMIDHVSMAFDGTHFSADSAGLYQAGTQLTAAVFLTRWMTHLCAPTFVISLLFLTALYPMCRWYRSFKKNHPGAWTGFI